jgi:hypothetical protein
MALGIRSGHETAAKLAGASARRMTVFSSMVSWGFTDLASSPTRERGGHGTKVER